MTIFDLPALLEDEALRLARETVSQHPVLAEIYDDETLREIIRRRRADDNRLLLRLVQPNDAGCRDFWSLIATDLTFLKPEGAIAVFRSKLRRHESYYLTESQTELWIAAWLKRNGIPVRLEPPTVGARVADISADTNPATIWEIKSLRDIEDVRTKDAIERDVQRRLRTLKQPYVLSVDAYPEQLADVPQRLRRSSENFGGTLKETVSFRARSVWKG